MPPAHRCGHCGADNASRGFGPPYKQPDRGVVWSCLNPGCLAAAHDWHQRTYHAPIREAAPRERRAGRAVSGGSHDPGPLWGG